MSSFASFFLFGLCALEEAFRAYEVVGSVGHHL